MSDDKKIPKITDLVDLNFLQKIQDFFAVAMDMASITIDQVGPVTNPSNFTEFCIKYTRESESGFKKCNDCGLYWGEIAAQKNAPIVYTCAFGLTAFAVPIIVNGLHVGSMIAGQILTSKPDEDYFRKIALELGINEDEYINSVRKIKVLSPEKVNAAADLLYQVGNAISEIAHKNLDINEKSNYEQIYTKVLESIRQSINIDDTKRQIVDIVGKSFNADRCFIMDYDKEKGLFSKILYEYKSSEEVPSYTGNNVNKDVPNIMEECKQGNFLVIDNKKIFISGERQNYKPENVSIEKFKVNSAYGFPLIYQGEFLGALGIHYLDSNRSTNQEEINLLGIISNQLAIAIHQATLFRANEIKAQREAIIAKILTLSIKTFDMEQIKPIVKDIGLITKADRCYFVEVDENKLRGLPIDPNYEYLASPDVKSAVGYEFSEEQVRIFIEIFLKNADLTVFDYEKIKRENNEGMKNTIDYAELFMLKSGVGIPFFHIGKLVSVLAIEYTNESITPSAEELNFMRILGNQIGMAFNQINNYRNLKKTAERESVLRKIIEAVRSSLDITEVKRNITYEMGKIFKADRCYFRFYDNIKNEFLAPDVEYLSSPEISSLVNVEPDQEGLKYFSDEVKRQKRGFYPVIVNEESVKGTPLEAYMTSSGIKADYAIPIIDRNEDLTWLVLHYSKEDPKFDDDYKKLFETIGYQIDIAFEQIKLYNATRKSVQKERSLREIFETVRSSLDVNVVKNKIVETLGKILNADRCVIVTYNNTNDSYVVDQYSEYRSSMAEKSVIDLGSEEPKVGWFINSFKKTQEMQYPNIKDLLEKNNLLGTREEDYIKEYGIKSYYRVPLFSADELFGFMVIHYTKAAKRLTVDEWDMIKITAIQAGIALHQAELYKTTRTQAEREKLSRNIVEILRSSLDKNTIKNLFVKNIGKYFKADRVFFSDYDEENNKYLPVESSAEYLSDSAEKSFVGYDWSNEKCIEYIQPLLDKRELKISDWNEYIKSNPKGHDFINLFEEANVKSSYNFPVLYQGKIMGYFCIEFTQIVNRLSEEDINRIRNMCTQAGIALYHATLYEKAQFAFQFKGKFIKNVSYIFKTPLVIIMEIIDIIRQSNFDLVEIKEKLSSITEICKHLYDAADEIANRSIDNSEDIKSNYENFYLDEIVFHVVNSIKIIANKKNVQIIVSESKINVYLDKKILIQILYNFLNTAIKDSTENAKIIIESQTNDDKLIISIEYTKQQVKELLEQAKSTIFQNDTLSELTTAQKFIELHGGNIDIENLAKNETKINLIFTLL